MHDPGPFWRIWTVFCRGCGWVIFFFAGTPFGARVKNAMAPKKPKENVVAVVGQGAENLRDAGMLRKREVRATQHH